MEPDSDISSSGKVRRHGPNLVIDIDSAIDFVAQRVVDKLRWLIEKLPKVQNPKMSHGIMVLSFL